MGLADIVKKIEEDATHEADGILAEAQEKAEEIQSASKKTIDDFERRAESDRERRASKAAERIISAARHEAKFIHETFKNKLIDRVFEEVGENLSHLSASAYEKFLKEALQKLGTSTAGAMYLIAHERSKETKKVLKGAGVSETHITVAAHGALGGGFIATTPQEEFDVSFVSMIERLRAEEDIEVSRILFS